METEKKLYTENEMINFVDLVIHQDKCFNKTYKVGDLDITMRTRSMPETGFLMEYSNEFKTPTSMLHNICMATLGYTLVKINDKNFDVGQLEDRVNALKNFPAPKFKILVDTMDKFNQMVDQMTKDFDLFYKAP